MMIWPVDAFAGEGDLVDVHVLADGGAGGRAVAGHDVDDAIGEAGFLSQRGHAQGGQRRLLGRLQDDGAAGRQGRTPLPGLHQQREVPRNDLADDADRLVPRVAEVRSLDGDGLAVDLVGPAGVVAIALDGQRQVGVQRIAQRLAVVERFEGGQLFLVAASMRSASLLSSRPRSEAFIFGHGPSSNALRAALTARSTSALSPSATWQMVSPVAGLSGRKRLARHAVEPFAADEQRLLLLDLGRLDGALFGLRRGSHEVILLS